MPVNLVPEDDLRAALQPSRVDPTAFEAGVRQRLQVAVRQHAEDPLWRLSPLMRSAAAFLPLALLAGCKATPAAAKLAPAGGAYKLLGYLAFPAISLFVLLGATIFSAAKIRTLRDRSGAGLADEAAVHEAIREWWRRYKPGAIAVFAATLILMAVGETWILFLFILVSFGILLLVLASFAKLGLGNRAVIGQSCSMGLMFLGQAGMMAGMGDQEIHFVDQKTISAVFFGGMLALLPFAMSSSPLSGWRVEKMPRWIWPVLAVQALVTSLLAAIEWWKFASYWTAAALLGAAILPLAATIYRACMAGQRIGETRQRLAVGLAMTILIPLMAWLTSQLLWPATPSRIKRYVESFASAPYGNPNWRNWEIAASWAIDSKQQPDLSRPRRLLADEIAGQQNPFILSTAMRVGLLPADEVGQLKAYKRMRRSLVVASPGLKPHIITSLPQYDWVIRASVLLDDLSSQERDLLEQRLHATLESLSKSPFDQSDVLETSLRATQLLEVIRRPVDRDRYRGQVHDWLRKFHSTSGGGFQLAGGFKQYPKLPVGSLEATSHGIELMEIYGVPDGLDLNWVRSYLRPLNYRPMDQKWAAAAMLYRLNRLPGATRPTWLEMLYYERTLLAAAVLVGLCVYATLASPPFKPIDFADGSSPPDFQGVADE